MRQIKEIARKELSTLFYSPAGWLILLIFGVHAVFCLVGKVDSSILMMQKNGIETDWYTRDYFSLSRGVFPTITYYLFIYIPFLTMGLFSKEFSEGGVRLLFSSPLQTHQIILGKYAAMLVTGLMMISVYGMLAISLRLFVLDHVDVPLILSGMLISYLVICLYAAIGLFISSLTSYMLVSAVGTFAILFVLQSYLGNLVGNHHPFFLQVLVSEWLPPAKHVDGIFGILNLADLLYFLLLILLFLLFTWLRIYFLKNPRSIWYKVLVYSGVTCVCFLVGWYSYHPERFIYKDFTSNDYYTPGEELATELNKLPGTLKFKRYVNILEQPAIGSMMGFSGLINTIQSSRRTMRIKPEIEYIPYYGHTKFLDNSLLSNDSLLSDGAALVGQKKAFYNRNTIGMNLETLKEIAVEKNSWLQGLNIRTADQLNTELDGKLPESNRFYFLESDSLRGRLPIRLGNPNEQQLTTTLKEMNRGKILAGYFLENGERDPFGQGDRDYWRMLGDSITSNSLFNNGYEIIQLHQGNPIPDHLSLLIIADPSKVYSEQTVKKIIHYLDKGGSMLLTTSPERENNIAGIFNYLGIYTSRDSCSTGYAKICGASVIQNADSVQGILNKQVMRFNKFTYPSTLTDSQGHGLPIATTAALGLSINENYQGFRNYPLAICGNDTIIYGFSRFVQGKEQRVLVAGSADFMSNQIEGIGFLSSFKTVAANRAFILSIYNWFTSGEYPVFIKRTELEERLKLKDAKWFKYGLISLMILPFLFVGLPVLIKRRRI